MFKAGYQTINPARIIDPNELRFQFLTDHNKANEAKSIFMKDYNPKTEARVSKNVKNPIKGKHKSSMRELMANE